jgi:CheY-like chemotaxis protein
MTSTLQRERLSESSAAPATRSRSDEQLLHDQLAAIDAWHRLRRSEEAAARAAGADRERSLDASRRLDLLNRQQRELCDWAEQQLRQAGRGTRPGRSTAVLAHRHSWLRDKLTGALAQHDVEVVCAVEDGARAWAALVVEQPELVFVEDRLPGTSGLELIRMARELAPHTLIGAQTETEGGLPALLDAGAHAVFTRRVPPAIVAEELNRCLAGVVSGVRIA